MDYKLAKKLKDVGFPQIPQNDFYFDEDDANNSFTRSTTTSTLEELIEACSKDMEFSLNKWSPEDAEWTAKAYLLDSRQEFDKTVRGKSMIEAVANLYIELNKK